MWTLSNHIREFPAHLWSFSICLTLDVIITMMTWLCCGAGYIKSLKLCNSNQALQTLLLHASLNKHPWALVCSMAHGSSFTTVSWRALIMDHASTGHLGSCHFPHSNLSWPQAVPPLPPDWLITIKYGRVDTPHGVRMASRSFEGNWENICPVHVIPLTHNDAGGSTFLMGAVFKNKKTKTHRINNVLQSCGHGSSVWGWGAVRISPLSSVHRDVRRSPEWLHVLAPQSDNINNSLRSRRAGSPAAGSQAWHNFLREHWLNPPANTKIVQTWPMWNTAAQCMQQYVLVKQFLKYTPHSPSFPLHSDWSLLEREGFKVRDPAVGSSCAGCSVAKQRAVH